MHSWMIRSREEEKNLPALGFCWFDNFLGNNWDLIDSKTLPWSILPIRKPCVNCTFYKFSLHFISLEQTGGSDCDLTPNQPKYICLKKSLCAREGFVYLCWDSEYVLSSTYKMSPRQQVFCCEVFTMAQYSPNLSSSRIGEVWWMWLNVSWAMVISPPYLERRSITSNKETRTKKMWFVVD